MIFSFYLPSSLSVFSKNYARQVRKGHECSDESSCRSQSEHQEIKKVHPLAAVSTLITCKILNFPYPLPLVPWIFMSDARSVYRGASIQFLSRVYVLGWRRNTRGLNTKKQKTTKNYDDWRLKIDCCFRESTNWRRSVQFGCVLAYMITIG